MAVIIKNTKEEPLVDVKFNVYKFTDKEKPVHPNDVVIFHCFSEFGCTTLGALYSLPRIIEENKGKYLIVMGWYGLKYLYAHLVDEFWELKEDFQFLRDHALAFHSNSKNLNKIEKAATKYGRVITANMLGEIAVNNKCKDCCIPWGQMNGVVLCPSCKSDNITKCLFADVNNYKKTAVKVPEPSSEKMLEAKNYLKPKSVAITARNRKTYGRNLQIEFYEKLIYLLEEMGYNPIWIGEKHNTYRCPVKRIVDLTEEKHSDFELTLAVVKQCEFTVQFWTASTRLAGIMGVPYLLFESPDQLFGTGQEAFRLNLCTFGHRKLALCHYLNVFNDNASGLKLVKRCVEEMNLGNYNDVIGMVDQPDATASQRAANLWRLN